jgi:hypothetical protein
MAGSQLLVPKHNGDFACLRTMVLKAAGGESRHAADDVVGRGATGLGGTCIAPHTSLAAPHGSQSELSSYPGLPVAFSISIPFRDPRPVVADPYVGLFAAQIQGEKG